jgi:TadE-like protein
MLVSKNHSRRRCSNLRQPRGSVLVEFALISLVLYLILAATLEFGRALFGAQILQQAADTAAREISRTPGLPVVGTLTDWNNPSNQNAAFNTTVIKQTIYDEQYTVVHPIPSSGLDYFNDKPILNRLLAPLMIRDTTQDLLYYPGALVTDANMPSGFHVEIPIVSNAGGTEAIVKNVRIVEEILPNPSSDPTSSDNSPFSLVAPLLPASNRGVVALRINYPFQAVSMSATAPNPNWPPDPNFNYIQVPASEAGETAGVYAGPNGLGNQLAMGQHVRPFRRLISAQAIYRREVFGP